ncbi:hypothetical protein GEMRC1_009783 [Eukaryota sp. GEM-RC1]
MSHSEHPMDSRRSLNETVSLTDVVECNGSCFSISSSNPNTFSTSTLCSTVDSPSDNLYFPQTLLTLINMCFLCNLSKYSLDGNRTSPRRVLVTLKIKMHTFFKKVGYVSHRFFESALHASKVFLETNTFHVVPKDLPPLCSFASFFGTDIQSVFFYVSGFFKKEEMLNYSHKISGLELELKNNSDLCFFSHSSLFFEQLRLKQFHLRVSVPRGWYSMFSPLIELLKVDNTVTSLNLAHNSIVAEDVSVLSDLLKDNVTITSVNLMFNEIEDNGATALAETLKAKFTLTYVILSRNSIGDNGARALADAFRVNTKITSINVGGNYIGDKGARALADALKVNTTITSIDLAGNRIGARGARALAEALKVNDTATSINLWNNSIGDKGARALAEALRVNVTVTSINLGGNSIGDKGAKTLADALKVNGRLTTFDLVGNSIGERGVEALAEALTVNRKVNIEGIFQLN